MGLFTSKYSELPLPPKKEINFDELPYALRISVYDKFTYPLVATFEECSISAHSICKSKPTKRFPFEVDSLLIVEDGTLIQDLSHIVTATDSVYFQPRKLLLDTLNNTMCEIILKCIRTDKFVLQNQTVSSLEKLERLKGMNIHSMDIFDAIEFTKTFPSDFSNVSILRVTKPKNLPLPVLFSIRAEFTVCLDDFKFTTNQLISQLKMWKNGQWTITNTFQLRNMISFDPPSFIAAMSRRNLGVDESEYEELYEWNMKREDKSALKIIYNLYTGDISLFPCCHAPLLWRPKCGH